MGKRFEALAPAHVDFIARQRIFFAASAAQGARVNISPRPTEAFRVVSPRAALYLDRTGSGNETSAHLAADGRLTFMFCAFDGPPMILRLYGRGRVIARGSAEYAEALATLFDGIEPPGARQMVRLDIDLVQSSCGFGVPLFDYRGERPNLDAWARSKGEAGMVDYRRDNNRVSLDGLPTGLIEAPADGTDAT